MQLWISCFGLMILAGVSHQQTTELPINATTVEVSTNSGKRKFTCPYVPGAIIDDDSTRRVCCDHITSQYARRWYTGGRYLTTHLSILKSWKCPEFEEECKIRTFQYNEFTKYVYMRECDNGGLHRTCLGVLKSIPVTKEPKPMPLARMAATDAKEENTTNLQDEWDDFISNLDPDNYELESLLDPCMQIAMYDHESSGYGRFHEIVNPFIPFCEFVWCGVDKQTLEKYEMSTWKCMPSRCRTNIIVAMTMIGLLGVVTLLGNVTIIIVFVINRHLRNSQAFYKCTLAFGDLLVGGIVYPTFISSFYFLYITPHELGRELRTEENGTLPVHAPGTKTKDFFSEEYLKVVGFFTTFSLFVSVYSLMAASFDRLVAIMRPLSYDRTRSQLVALIGCIIILTCGTVFACIPFFVKRIEYTLVASLLIASSGKTALILYSVAFALPLFMVWVSTLGTMGYVRVNTKRLQTSNSSSKHSFELRLFKTLAIMVGVFTAVILPAVIIMLVPFAIDNVFTYLPKLLDPNISTMYTSLEFVASIILMSNSLWNVFIYTTRHKEFRKAAIAIHIKFFNTITRCRSSRTRIASARVCKSVHTKKGRGAELESVSTNSTIISGGGKSRLSLPHYDDDKRLDGISENIELGAR